MGRRGGADMLNPDKYILDTLEWLKDFISQNPITASFLVGVIAKLAKKYPWFGRLVAWVKGKLTWRATV
jgi:hypothetical protein